LEREEFYRLKKIQDKKRIARKKAELKAEKLKQMAIEIGIEVHAPNMLDEGDEDLLF
jgi:V-type H+-transporting ATPase subunit D